MTFLIDILHPAHVHFFRHLHAELTGKGHRVVVTAREKEMAVPLLREYGIEHTVISRQRKGLGLILEMCFRSFRLLLICLRHRPALLLGIMGPSIAVVGFVLRIPRWIFYDTENAGITNRFAYPLASRVYTPQCYLGGDRSNQIRYAGYHELAYLHPRRFVPNPEIPRKYGLESRNPYFILRFVAWQASHDWGERGIAAEGMQRMVAILEEHGRVRISSEAPLPGELANRKLDASIEEIHHLLAFSRMVVGESATMASEAAVLGVPAIFISDTLRGYTIDEEKQFGLVRNFSTREMDQALEAVTEELTNDPKRHATARERLLEEMVDVTSFMHSEINQALRI